jgi:ubiquinone/menaquinone biosynthesis C-methylase UbiE
MRAQQQMMRVYDRAMVGDFARQYYDNSGFFNFGCWTGQTTSQQSASENLVDELVARLPDKSGLILDVACGVGASSKRLAKSFRPEAITGVNISEAQLAHARERCPATTFVVMDATNLQFPHDQFDAVICVEAAFHFNTRDDFFREAYRVMKPGGSIVISDILFRSFTRWAGRLAHVPVANQLRDGAEYRAHMASAGFVEIEIEDATNRSLSAFCRYLTRWPWREYKAGRMNLGRAIASGVTCALVAVSFALTCKTYLLVSARKPSFAATLP